MSSQKRTYATQSGWDDASPDASAPRAKRARSAPLRSRGKKARRSTSVKGIKALVKKTLYSIAETKLSSVQNPAQPYCDNFNASISSAAEFYQILPPVGRGTGENMRVGDSITPTKLRVTVTLALDGTYDSSANLMARLFIVGDRENPSVNNGNASDPRTLLDAGGAPKAFQGYPTDLTVPVDSETWITHVDKIVSLAKGAGTMPNFANSYVGTQTCVPINQAKVFTFDIKPPKHLLYTQGTDNYPTNWNPVLAIGYVQPDGVSAPDYTTRRLKASWFSTLYFKDM